MRNIGFVVVNRLAVPLTALVLLIVIGRQSGQLLGEYALAMSFYFVMQTLPLLGLTPYVMRQVARVPADAAAYFTTIGGLAVVSCAVIDAGVEALLPLLGYAPPLRAAIGIVALSIVPGILVFLAEIILISLGRSRPVAIAALVENALRLLASVAALRLDGGVVALMWILFAGRTGAFLCYLAILAERFPLWRPDAAILRQTIAVLPAFLASGVVYVLVSRFDFIVLSIWEPIEQVGYYGIAYRAYEIAMLAASAVLTGLYPGLALRARGPLRRFLDRVRLYLQGIVVTAVPLALLGYALAPSYVYLFFRREYPHPVLLTQLFFLLLVLGLADQFLSFVLNSADRQKLDAASLITGGTVFAASLFLLVPTLHVLGAFLAMALTVAVQLSLRWHWIASTLGAPLTFRVMLRWGLVAVPFILLVVWLAARSEAAAVLVTLAAGATLYPLALAGLGIFNASPLRRLFARCRFRHLAAVRLRG